MADAPSSTLTRAERRGWSQWLAALLFGVLVLLALFIASWFLRACAPVDASINLATFETPAPPALPPAFDPLPTLKASLDEVQAAERRLKGEVAAVQTALEKKVALCKPSPSRPVARALPADRWAQKDLGILQGCWRLGKDTQGNMGVGGGRSERCDVKAGRICFGGDGRGERQISAICPGTGAMQCAAPITARFGNDNTLGTTQPAVRCTPAATGWNGPPNSLTCRRVNDALALCRDGLNFEYEFRRE